MNQLVEDTTKVAKDAVYITIGFGVQALHRAQVLRQDLRKELDERLGTGKEQAAKLQDGVEEQLKGLDERLTAIEERVDHLLDQVEAKLPEQAAEVLHQVRDAARTARRQVRDLVLPTDEQAEQAA